MKRTLIKHICIILTLFIHYSCNKIDLKSFVPEEAEISFAVQELNASNALDTIKVQLNSNLPFRLSTSDNWITFVKANGTSSQEVEIIIARNRETNSRVGTIEAYITPDVKSIIRINQAAGEVSTTTTDYYVKSNGSTDGEGLSWTNAVTLQRALELAESGDVIHMAAGRYIPSVNLSGGNNAVDVTFEIAENITMIGGYPEDPAQGAISNPTLYKTELNGDDKVSHVLTIVAGLNENQQVKIEGVTITKGRAGIVTGNVTSNGLSVSRSHGAGLIIVNSKVELKNVLVTDNISQQHNPGVYITNLSEVTMHNVTISNNSSTVAASNGGGIWNDGSKLTIFDSQIIGNRIGGVGAGLYSLNTNVTSVNIIYNVTIANNQSGIFGNNSTGAGIYAREKSLFYIINSTIFGNVNGGNAYGAGVSIYGAAEVNLISSTVTGNQGGMGNAGAGGVGIHNNGGGNNNLRIYNSIVSGNTSNASLAQQIGTTSFSVYDVKSSIIADKITDYDGVISNSLSFDISSFGTFSNNGGYGNTVPLIGISSATTEGMTNLQLQILGVNHNRINGDYLLLDQNNKSRNNLRVMGANAIVK